MALELQEEGTLSHKWGHHCFPKHRKALKSMDNIPNWVVIMVGIANFFQIFSAIALIALGVVGVGILLQIKGIVMEAHSMVKDELRKDILPSVTGTMKNVEKISADAADTTHNVTATVNRVSNLVGSVSNRLESPLIKAVGLASGVLAAGRSMKGQKNATATVVVEKKKRRGFFG